MLAARREFKVIEERFRTPLIVPSYSSRAVEDEVREVINVTRAFVRGPILISAYDVKHYGVRQRNLDHSSLVFLDSGGYEAGRDSDLSDIEPPRRERPRWSIVHYRDVLTKWDFSRPTVLTSYDDPYGQVRLDRQLARAERNKRDAPDACHLILVKPEPIGRRLRKKERLYVDIDKILDLGAQLGEFDIIGLTEKELGNSVFSRMKLIAKLRKGLMNLSQNIPIHVFGSLDPVSSPLYFLSGADIFDGLTWLRYAYYDGLAVYRQNYLARGHDIPIRTRDGDLSATVHLQNYLALGKLEEAMLQFMQSEDFDVFGSNANFFKNAMEKLKEEIGG